jgi:alanine racemase
MARALKAEIDSIALKHNLDFVRKKAPHSKIIAMIKANGYGHGLINVAKTFENDVEAFGVACIEEAIQLRENHFTNRIVIVEGFFTQDELPEIARLKLEPVIHTQEQIDALIRRENQSKTNHAKLKPISIWIKLDTGMHRLGFSPEEFKKALIQLTALKYINIQGYLSHFASAEEIDNPITPKQIALFKSETQALSQDKSLANSAGILLWPHSHLDWVRPGIMLYGVSPIPNQTGEDLGLKPAMTLQSELIAIHDLKKGDAVGYGGIFVCPEPMRVGVVAVGYADGYHRLTPNGAPVLIHGKKASIVGRVSMDMITVDLRGIPEAKVGDQVILWGKGLPVEEVATHIGTIGYELLTGLSIRVPVVVNKSEQEIRSKQATTNK